MWYEHAYRIIYCPTFNPEQSIQPNLIETGDEAMLMMFIALFHNNNKCTVVMDTMCQGSGFLTQAFCNAASPQITISKVSNNPHIKTLPSVTTGNGRIGTALGFAQVRMILDDFVSDVEFVVFGKFAGFDAVLGQEWLKRYQCVLDMGTGSVTISADNRNFIIRTIDTRH